MSLMWSLQRFIDSITFVREDKDRKRQLKQVVKGFTDPGWEVQLAQTVVKQPEVLACRICGKEGARGTFCPDCLADTMVPKKK